MDESLKIRIFRKFGAFKFTIVYEGDYCILFFELSAPTSFPNF